MAGNLLRMWDQRSYICVYCHMYHISYELYVGVLRSSDGMSFDWTFGDCVVELCSRDQHPAKPGEHNEHERSCPYLA